MTKSKSIFDNYCSVFPSFEFFCQIMDQCTQNYECLVIDNTSQSSKIEDCVFWYKAEIHPDFRIGAAEFWAHSAQHYKDSNGEGGMNDYDPNAARKLKGPAIQVRKFPQT
jgi:hypothetical protein